MNEQNLDRSKRRIADAEARIERQQKIICELERDNHLRAAQFARKVLVTYETNLRLLRRILDTEKYLCELNGSISLPQRP